MLITSNFFLSSFTFLPPRLILYVRSSEPSAFARFYLHHLCTLHHTSISQHEKNNTNSQKMKKKTEIFIERKPREKRHYINVCKMWFDGKNDDNNENHLMRATFMLRISYQLKVILPSFSLVAPNFHSY